MRNTTNMKMKIEELEKLIDKKLQQLGFQLEEAKIVARHLVDAELSGKKGHGVGRIKHFQDKMESEQFNPSSPEPKIEKETTNSLRINGYARSGIYVIEKFLSRAMDSAKAKEYLLWHPTLE